MANKVSKLKFNNVTYDLADESSRVAINNLEGQLEATRVDLNNMRAAVGSPLTATTTSAMTNTSKVYVYTGTTTTVSGVTFTAGNWYYHDGTKWQLGGTYNETALETDTTLTVSGAAADAKVTGDKVTELKNALGQTNDILDSLERFTRKTVTREFSADESVTSGSYSASTHILDADIPEGQTYTVRISTTATHGNITIYEHHTDGSYRALSYNVAVDTDLQYTAGKDVSGFNLLVANGGFTSAGVVSITVTYAVVTEGSLEERVESMEAGLGNTVSKESMEFLNLVNMPASVNRIDPSKYQHGKQINWAFGQVTDSASSALYYLDVNPGDTVYFWRYHKRSVIEGYSNSIAVFDENGNFITRGGIGGNQYSYTVPENVYKLGLNFNENHLNAGDKMMAVINSATNPGVYIPFHNANNAYFSTDEFLRDVDFNQLLPLSCKLPEDGFIKSYGHAGLSAYYPLNTAPAIIGAKKAGLGGVEVDVQITSDGVYVLFHDEDLRRVGGTQQQTIAGMTYAQLQQFDYGSWFSPRFAGTEICTLDKAAQLCRELGLEIWLDCKAVKTQEQFLGAKTILDKWGIADKSYWIVSSFVNIWTAIPDAKVLFAAGNALTGNMWDNPDTGWFNSFNGNFPDDKKEYKDGLPVVPDGVWFGVTQNYALMDGSYGIAGLIHESELAKERNIKYGFYAVDDIDTIAELSENVPHQQYFASNAIAYQTALNAHYGITKADYLLDV